MKILDLTDKTIAQLVRETGISRSTLADIVKGNTEFKNASLENAVAIAEALDTTIDDLYNKIYNNEGNEINLNNDMYINIDTLSYGTTDLKVKISRNYYFVRVEKNKFNSYIDVKVQDGDFKKRLGGSFIKNNAFISKEFILNIKEIEDAQTIVKKYNRLLDMNHLCR